MKKKAALGLAGLAAVAAIGGTWAYWNQNLSVNNEFKAGNFDSDIVEEFKPEEDWLPGETVKKVVSVKNSGNVDMAVMTKITQKWDGEKLTLQAADGTEYAAEVQWGENVAAFAAPGVADIAAPMGIEKTVDSFADADDTWVLTDIKENEDGSQDLYFVYSGIVAEAGETSALPTSVTMNPLIQSGITSKKYEPNGSGGVDLVKADANYLDSYEDAQYTMTINAKTVQATFDAIKDVFGAALEMSDSDEEVVINDFLAANGMDKPAALEAE